MLGAIGEQSPIIGREREREALESFLRRACVAGGTCVLHGEAGVGKTRLLQACEELGREHSAQVLRASGVQFEADFAFGALHQLLRPLFPGLSDLRDVSSAALRGALGIGDPAPVGQPIAVYEGALALLELAARDAPVLLLLDDIHWIDRSSAAALTFIAHRIEGRRVAMISTLRTGEESHFDAAGLPSFAVGPLSPSAADELLRAYQPALPVTARRRLVRLSAGFPLALVEWGSDLDLVLDLETEIIPLPRRLEMAFESRIGRLPAEARRAVLTLALDGRCDLAELVAGGVSLDDLGPAELTGAITIDESAGVVVFRHPLFRSALVASSTSAERRAIHLRIADGAWNDPDRRTWHLAAAVTAPDESVARLLSALAHRSLARGDVQGASAALTRAASLSPSPQERTRLLAEAAFLGADMTGDLDRAAKLLADTRTDLGSGPGSLYAAVAHAQLAVNADGDHGAALQQIEHAVRHGSHRWRADDEELISTLRTWLLLCTYAGEQGHWTAYFDALEQLVPAAPETLLAESWAAGDTARNGWRARETVITLSTRQDAGSDPVLATSMTFASMYLDLIDVWSPSAWRSVAEGRDDGAPRPYARSLAYLAMNDFLHGRWQESESLADEGARVCHQHDFGSGAWYFAYTHALLAAARGDLDVAGERSAFVEIECARRGSWGAQRFAHQPRVLAAVAGGDWEEAYRVACHLAPPGEFPQFVPSALWVAFDLVEAGVRTGRAKEARAHARAMKEVGVDRVSTRMALLTAGALAVAEEGDGWMESFEAALRLPERESWPFDLARVELAYGERLRRAAETSRARDVLHDALDVFERIGSSPWAARATAELRAAGDVRIHSGHGPGPAFELTPQESAIAEMAARGLTNKEIGSRLFLSPRTVSGHLYNAFPKLGITSRAGLRDALAARRHP